MRIWPGFLHVHRHLTIFGWHYSDTNSPYNPKISRSVARHSLLSPRWVNTSSTCWRQTRTPPSRTPALFGLGWIPLDLGAFNLGLIAPVTAQTLGYISAWSPGTALSHLGSASLVAQGHYSDIGLKNVGTNGLSFVFGLLSYRTSIYTCRYT